MPKLTRATALKPAQIKKLIAAATEARSRAYAPYSNYLVGAALWAADGTIFVGCNVENAAYPMTNCAERVAVGAAVAAGQRQFLAVAVVTKEGGSPCGACRQVLAEFAPKMAVFIADARGQYRSTTLDKLLPDNFALKTEL